MMRTFTLSEWAQACRGQLVGADQNAGPISIDSRTLAVGDVYLALRGERLDGHKFIAQAQASGASALIVERPEADCQIPQIVVADSTQALADIARLNRQQFTGDVIAITGSSGKTTVKEMLAEILKAEFSESAVHVTAGNFNNHIGVPLTLLQLSAEHKIAVVEMGASGLGEIAYLVDCAEPTVALVNNVMPAHVEGFGSLQGIAETKGAIYQGAATTAVMNIDCEYCPMWQSSTTAQRQISYSVNNSSADLSAQNITISPAQVHFDLCITDQNITDKNVAIELHIPGQHNIANALAAAACALSCGVSLKAIAAGLAKLQPVKGRLQTLAGINHCTVIDDSYNANPGSVKAALETLAVMPGKRALVLGDMGELGEQAQALHKEVGEFAKACGVDALFSAGPLSALAAEAFANTPAHIFSERDSLAQALSELADSDWTFLVKGSRSAGMDKVVEQLVTAEAQKNATTQKKMGRDVAPNNHVHKNAIREQH